MIRLSRLTASVPAKSTHSSWTLPNGASLLVVSQDKANSVSTTATRSCTHLSQYPHSQVSKLWMSPVAITTRLPLTMWAMSWLRARTSRASSASVTPSLCTALRKSPGCRTSCMLAPARTLVPLIAKGACIAGVKASRACTWHRSKSPPLALSLSTKYQWAATLESLRTRKARFLRTVSTRADS